MSPLQHCLIVSMLWMTILVTKVTNFLHFNTNLSFFREKSRQISICSQTDFDTFTDRFRYVQRLLKIRS